MSKSVGAFSEHFGPVEGADGLAIRSATYCFFAGMILIALINLLVHWMEYCALRPCGSKTAEVILVTIVHLGKLHDCKCSDTCHVTGSCCQPNHRCMYCWRQNVSFSGP